MLESLGVRVDFLDGKLILKGDLIFLNVQDVYDQIKLISTSFNQDFSVDLSAVKRVDSASLALCLSIQRMAAHDVKVSYLHVPIEMLDIAKSVGVAALFKDGI
ncbi:MAG: STAS domain-containing protein [Oceanospirillaceae bacterium]